MLLTEFPLGDGKLPEELLERDRYEFTGRGPVSDPA